MLPLILAATLLLDSGDTANASEISASQCTVGCAPPHPRPAAWNAPNPAHSDAQGIARLPTPAQRPASWNPSEPTESPASASAEEQNAKRFPVPAPRPATLLPAATAGPLEAGDVQLLRSVLAAARTQKWRQALDAAAGAKSPLPGVIARGLWLAADDAKASFVATLDFLEAHPDWPERQEIRRRLEERIVDTVGHRQILRAFEAEPPQTGPGWLHYALALEREGEPDRARVAARTAWREHALSIQEERTLLGVFGSSLAEEDHFQRLNNLIWSGDWGTANRQLRRVPQQWRLLGEARITLGRRIGDADRAVARVPAELRNYPALVYERARWRRRSGLDQAAQDILVPLPDELPAAHRWWDEINLHVRDRLGIRDFEEAYRLASAYTAFEGEDRRQGAWLAGWIALEFLRRPPEEAMVHFEEARKASWHPADVSLAAYWQFRAAARMGDLEAGRGFAEEAARWSGTFFGQLALRSLGRPLRIQEPPSLESADLIALETKSSAQLLLALGQADGHDFAWPSAESLLIDVTSSKEAAALIALCMRAGMTRHALRAARRSISMGHDLPQLLFLIPSEERFPRDAVHDAVPLPVALAISNQESGFDREAVSHAGARGLMQLMPGTARDQARRLSIPYQVNRLVEDPAYNIQIGSAFLHGRIDHYGGSIPLALAAYNAGSGNVGKWLRAHGDPRGNEANLVNWILLIPLTETRNYVQRVMERISAYEILLSPGASPSIPLRHLAS